MGEEQLKEALQQARRSLQRIRIDTYVGMGFSNLIASSMNADIGACMVLHGQPVQP